MFDLNYDLVATVRDVLETMKENRKIGDVDDVVELLAPSSEGAGPRDAGTRGVVRPSRGVVPAPDDGAGGICAAAAAGWADGCRPACHAGAAQQV